MKSINWNYFLVFILFVSASCGNNDEDLFDNLNSLPESSRVFYLLNNDQIMKWSTDGETWTDIYKTFNATQNTPNNAQFQTDGKRVYAYAAGVLYDAEKGAYYNVIDLGIDRSNQADFAVSNLASHVLDYTNAEIKTIPHGFTQFSTFNIASTGISAGSITDFISNSSVVFAISGGNTIIYSDDDGVSWKMETITVGLSDAQFSEVSAWGDDFYAVYGMEVLVSNNALDWTILPIDYSIFTSANQDTAVSLSFNSVFADEEYVNFLAREVVNPGGPLIERNILMESDNGGQTWIGTEIDISEQTDGQILFMDGVYVREMNSSVKGDKSLHYSSDLENWELIEGEKMYMENVYQLYKAQTVR